MPQDKKTKPKPLKSIQTSKLMRGFSLAKTALNAGSLGARKWLGQSQAGWLPQIEMMVEQLGRLKGSAVKVGQTLSMYGEHLLPKEVNDLFKKLQQEAPPLDWPAIEKVLRKELGDERLSKLEIDKEALASASIGQVHRAILKENGRRLALKVQYPGVDQAVESDLKILKFILTLTEMIPRGARFDQVFAEIRDMFDQEVNYESERAFQDRFRELLKGEERFVIPETHAGFSTRRVLTTDFAEGVRIDTERVQGLPLERRNRLGRHFLELYLREFWEFRLVQTDPHFGNYLVDEDERLVLLDFGAVRAVPDLLLESYTLLVEGGMKRDRRLVEQGGRRLGLLQPEDSLQLVNDYVELCFLITEPFQGVYNWGASDLPKRVAAAASKILVTHRLRAPPRELVFLDRKLGGVFVFLSGLKCEMDTREVLTNAIERYRRSLKSRRPSSDRE